MMKTQVLSKKFCFVGGLPRSGSTLLCNILAQNPRFRSDGVTSGLLELLVMTRNQWAMIPELKSWSGPGTQKRVMRGLFDSYYGDSDHPVVFDKHRGWPAHLEMIETLLETKARVILMVRDMRAIMASWEKIWRKSKDLAGSNMPLAGTTSVMDRVKFWSSPGEPTGFAFHSIQDALHRGFEDRLLFVDFDHLTHEPEHQIRRVYDFIGEDYFRHDFHFIEQRYVEKDPEPWMKDLHVVRQRVEPVAADWPQVLGPASERLDEANRLWAGRV